MIRIAYATALLCAILSTILFIAAWRRLGVARVILRTRGARPDALPGGFCKLSGILEADGPLVIAPFSERPALYARVMLWGVGPEGGAPRALWSKVLTSMARVTDKSGSVAVDMTGARMLVPREYRHGALRALVPEVKILPRVLSRAGYKAPPPSKQFFYLEEEVLLPGQRVIVIGQADGEGTVRKAEGGAMFVSNLTRWRVVLRVAWGPALAILMATIVALTGASVLGTTLWLR
jgi:hypothetical protein